MGILSGFKKGRFSKEEHKIIAEVVKNSGDSIETWKSLAEKLNRDPEYHANIRTAYEINLSASHKGKWKINEAEILLAHLFKNKCIGIDAINSFKSSHFKNILELKREQRYIVTYYRSTIKPILLSYHLGVL